MHLLPVLLMLMAILQCTRSVSAQADPVDMDEPPVKKMTLRGRCVDHESKAPLVGIPVRLFKVQGQTAPIVEIAKTVSDQGGEFAFTNLIPSREEDPLDPLHYLAFADADDRPIGASGSWWKNDRTPLFKEILIPLDSITVSGRVVDARGKPVEGARIVSPYVDGRAIDGIHSATSDGQGRFEIRRLPDFKFKTGGHYFLVSHPDYPRTELRTETKTTDIQVVLPDGCKVTGIVTDQVTGKPAARALVVAQGMEQFSETPATTNVAGEFQLVVPEGRFNFLAKRKDRVCVALTDVECLPGETKELAFQLITGGFITGKVTNTATGQSVTTSQGEPIAIGLFGPSEPGGKVISPVRLALVDSQGRYKVRAVPGDNFPYFVNIHGDRMAWDTKLKPPVIVKAGESTDYDMLITPPVPPDEKLKQARELLATFPAAPAKRTERIILEFRKLEHTVDETELWCLLMHDLVRIGRDAVPQLCAELDSTNGPRMLRRLGFALRAIGDPRSVPALIRAIPKTLLPASSDYGLIVADSELAEFMQQHDLNAGRGGQYFDLGRPVREIFGALHKLTGQNFEDDQLYGISLSTDPRRATLQNHYFLKHARQWQTWWKAHWKEWTDDAVYQKVNLKTEEEVRPPAPTKLSPTSSVVGVVSGATLSPPIQEGQHADHFCDLDTGYEPKWPAHIPRDESKLDEKELAAWAEKSGVDLMCLTRRGPDGTETFVLRSFGMKVWEIGPRDLRNIDKIVATGTLPEGREVGDLLIHFDAVTQRFDPDADAVFLYITREGNRGIIETTDRITKTANLNGMLGAPKGVGFYKGVKFNLKAIIP